MLPSLLFHHYVARRRAAQTNQLLRSSFPPTAASSLTFSSKSDLLRPSTLLPLGSPAYPTQPHPPVPRVLTESNSPTKRAYSTLLQEARCASPWHDREKTSSSNIGEVGAMERLADQAPACQKSARPPPSPEVLQETEPLQRQRYCLKYICYSSPY